MASKIFCPHFVDFMKTCRQDNMGERDIERIRSYCKNESYFLCENFRKYLKEKPDRYGDERRKWKRVNVGLNVRIKDKEGFRVSHQAYLMDVSAGGIRVKAKVNYLLSDIENIKRFLNMPLSQAMNALIGSQSSINRIVELEIRFPTLDLRTQGTIVWIRKVPFSDWTQFGIRFIMIDEKARNEINSFVETMLMRQFHHV